MNGYAIFFDYGDQTYRMPTNPEEIKVTSSMAIEKYEILKLGQVAVPVHMELKEYSFECEFPSAKIDLLSSSVIGMSAALGTPVQSRLGIPHYVYSSDGFKGASFYINLFEEWRSKLTPVRFIAGITTYDFDDIVLDNINTLVLIDELEITEKAGEEGDKYISFKLLEYKDYSKQLPLELDEVTGKTKLKTTSTTNPNSTGTYVVKSGDTLWAIAKKYYGDGSKYSKIFSANKDKIKNASLIYPGQKLVIPS